MNYNRNMKKTLYDYIDISFKNLFFFFMIGSFLGVVYEELLHFVQFHDWQPRSGVLYGPFNPVYGIGFVLFIVILAKKNRTRSILMTFLISAVIGGLSEFFLSFLGEKIFNVNSWDYSGYFLNIGGRTTIPFMVVWGLGGLAFMHVIYPFILKYIKRIPEKAGNIILAVLLVFMVLDCVLTAAVLFRQSRRQQGIPPANAVERLVDQLYPDDRLAEFFPNMVHDQDIG